MNTAQLTPRALDVIAASDEYTAPIFRERPGDRGLLEAAAKAAGHRFSWEVNLLGVEDPTIFDEEGFGSYWDPRTEDEDSFRLSVALGITVSKGYAMRGDVGGFDEGAIRASLDPMGATRHAVLRCAAAIAAATEGAV